MPDEVEEKVSWLLQRLQAECCHDGSWVENKGIVLAFHHESWKEKGAIDPIKKEKSLARYRNMSFISKVLIGLINCFSLTFS